ncbi:hypothetical protein Tsubulata_010108 [Turnera subulata]|uniref:TOD1/MUCI70 glycosyltransferase-like domain-containing protein n=1 Tax=Turnera subulata TaxID=218843 RepID=A0A9Q0J962_9ROSI|nr:hypothetical protein Tsubulata_010108 [Turnera subulata]
MRIIENRECCHEKPTCEKKKKKKLEIFLQRKKEATLFPSGIHNPSLESHFLVVGLALPPPIPFLGIHCSIWRSEVPVVDFCFLILVVNQEKSGFLVFLVLGGRGWGGGRYEKRSDFESGGTMNGGSLGLRGSYGSLQSPGKLSALSRKSSHKMLLLSSRDKERARLPISRYLGRRKVAMLLLFTLALLVFVWGSFTVSKESTSGNVEVQTGPVRQSRNVAETSFSPAHPCDSKRETGRSFKHPCLGFTLPPPPPSSGRRSGPRPCPVCYIPPEQARARMPCLPSVSPVLRDLSYVVDKYPVKTEQHGGSDFGGYPSLKQRNDSYNIQESMQVHCGFVKGSKPGRETGFDIDEADLLELGKIYEVIVASAIFGNYDIIQQPTNISEAARRHVPFFMFIDKETEAYMKNASVLDSSMRVGLWRIIVVRNIPYKDARRNGKVPKLLLHRILPNVRYSIWIDGKLQLVVDPYQVLERFLWRQNATFAISKHYRRFDVFEEAEANKAAGKYDNSSIDYQIEFYKQEGLTPYSSAKFPITSDVPEGCVIIREHIPITNLFTCLWFNEVDRFTSRDQLSFSTVRDKIMAKVNWSIKMFLDCERRNFVIQGYHRDLLEHMPRPPPPVIRRPPPFHTPPSRRNSVVRGTSGKSSSKRGNARRSGSRQHRKAAAGNRDKQVVVGEKF